MRQLLVLTVLAALASPVPAQEAESDANWTTIHMMGGSFSRDYKFLEEQNGDKTEELEYSLDSVSIAYTNFSGRRLGYLSDLQAAYPYSSDYKSPMANKGIIADYYGAVAWDLQAGAWTFMPSLGFHGDYSYISKDPIDENKSNHMFSFGVGAESRVLYRLSGGHNVYLAARGIVNTLEYSTASYDSREIRMKLKTGFRIGLGYALRL